MPVDRRGYVWAASSDAGQVGDPFEGATTGALMGLTAVPVIITIGQGDRAD